MTIILRLNLIVCFLATMSFLIPLAIRHRMPVQNVRGRAVCRIISIVILTTGLIAFLACMGRNTYYDSMVMDASTEEADSRYLPFSQGNGLTRLEESSQLRLRKNLPVIEGSSTLLPYYASMIEMIYPESIMELEEEECPFQYTEDEDLYYKLISGEVDMIFTEEAASAKANAELAKRGLKLVKTEIGQVAFVFFVNSSNEIDNLTLNQIKSIYAGGVTNWESLGGSDTPILTYIGDEGSSIRNYLHKIMGRLPLVSYLLTEESSSEETAVEEESQAEVSAVISYLNAAGAIGCTFSCFAHGFDVDKGVKLLRVDGVSPSTEEEGWEAYCLVEPVYCVTVESREKTNMKHIRDWVLSAQGQRLMKAAGYYPLED